MLARRERSRDAAIEPVRQCREAPVAMRRFHISILAWILLVGLSDAPPCAAADAPTPTISTLSVEPKSIELARFEHDPVEVFVIAPIADGEPPSGTFDLSFTASPGLEVKPGERLERTGDAMWPVTVRAVGDAADESGVDFRLAYTPPPNSSAPGSTAATIQLARGRLAVKVAPSRASSPADDAELSIKTDTIDINEYFSTRAYLVVKNKSNYPFSVDQLEFECPKFLNVVPQAESAKVAAHESWRLPLDIEIAKNISSDGASVAQRNRCGRDTGKDATSPQLGEWLILASVTLRRGEGSHEQKGVAVIDQKVKVGVPGVSDVLKVLDLPSIFLVPGALVVAAWSLLLGGEAAAGRKWLEWKNSSFWLVAVTLSIAIFGGLSLLPRGPNFLLGVFDTTQIALLWIGSIGGGAATCLAYQGWTAHRKSRRAARAETERRRHEPLPDDEPIDILQKLQRARLSLTLARYRRDLGGGLTQDIYVTGLPSPEAHAWIVPRMLLRQVASDDQANEQVQRIVAANKNPDGLGALIAALQAGLAQKQVRLEWERSVVRGPMLEATDRLGTELGPQSPVHSA